MLEDWGYNPMLPYFGLPVALGTVGKGLEAAYGLPVEPSLELAADWYWEWGEQSRTYGPDFKVTRALMHDEGVEEARQKYIANGRQDLLESNRTWHRYKFGAIAAARELFGDVLIGGVFRGNFDWSTSFLGGYEVEVINLEKINLEAIKLCGISSLVEIRVHNSTRWESATRVWRFHFKDDEERPELGPGGTLDQVFIWQERIP